MCLLGCYSHISKRILYQQICLEGTLFGDRLAPVFVLGGIAHRGISALLEFVNIRFILPFLLWLLVRQKSSR